MTALTLVISAPRTGSTLLCRDLASMGGLGSPREYLRGFGSKGKEAADAEDEIVARLSEGVQPEAPGIGAVKLMVQQSRPVAEALTGSRGDSPADAVSTVVRWARSRFERVMVIVLVRNTLDMAISRAVAEATGVYHSTSKRYRTEGEAPLEGLDMNQLILADLAPAVRDRLTLQKVAEEHADTALLVTYDHLTTQAEATAQRLVEHARRHGFAPRAEAPQRRLTKVVSTERATLLRQGFLDYLGSEPGC